DAEQGYESSLREDFGGFAGDNEVETEAPSVTTSPSGDTAIPVIHQRRASHGAASSPAATPVVRRGRWLPAVGAVAAMLL
ncbi:MAG: hypothetical protein KDI56_13555, partial [Xanthomonadales bacterium]|nr:hypothetical protein [Xanthomonadales bacterium]